ncbi:RusA family crossover junction endodeoxyribonuclease [Nocardioides sp.]|uniref:RusA family crossover junction endodeoxyribonuclease n=1 Tax=Nocardioides sp. TaxID=35761 RepID=UPI002C11DF2B|nr:RusA family crossover junction endodeoxyribonuclease [Nocardioides sp.]HXH79542.1 RusA family crossover junction endodeoxyribonuclease [Nocardioides sp.]
MTAPARPRPATEAQPVLVVAFTVDGEPQAWQRVRYNPRSGRMFNSDALKAAEAAVAWEYKRVAAIHGLDLPYAGEVALIVRAYSAKTRAPDLDNVVKLVSDALNKVAWVDDHQVKRILATMATDPTPRTVVEIITEGVTP